MSRRNVLVTGSSDPIGERLVRELLRDSRVGHVLAVSGLPPEHLPFPSDRRLTCIQVDLGRSRQVQRMLFGLARDVGIDVVAHTAMHRTPGEGGSPRAFQVNATRSLLDLCERHPTIKRVAIRSAAQVYRVRRDLPVLMEEDHPINLTPGTQKWVQDRVEADLTACTRMGMSNTQIVVLRMAEVLAPGTGSQLFDYLESPVCLLPLGFDPMLNVLTIEDAVDALARAIHSEVEGIINIPGADTLPLTASIRRWGRVGIPLPETLLDPLYWLRGLVTGHDFRYRQNRRRFHYSGVLDGARARQLLGYVPKHPVTWPAWTAPTEAASG